MRALALFACAAVVGGCSDEPTAEEQPPRAVERVCEVPDGSSGRPQTFEELVDHINLLPRPVTLPCILASFARPLELQATSNDFSAQPAYGPANPRTFLFFDDLIVAFVPDGPAKNLVELSLLRSDDRSLKGEFPLPVEETLDPATPYDEIVPDDESIPGTRCAFCHFNEERDPAIPEHRAYVSDVVRPEASHRVPLSDLWWQQEECQPAFDAERCAIFDALLAHGEVRERDF